MLRKSSGNRWLPKRSLRSIAAAARSIAVIDALPFGEVPRSHSRRPSGQFEHSHNGDDIGRWYGPMLRYPFKRPTLNRGRTHGCLFGLWRPDADRLRHAFSIAAYRRWEDKDHRFAPTGTAQCRKRFGRSEGITFGLSYRCAESRIFASRNLC